MPFVLKRIAVASFFVVLLGQEARDPSRASLYLWLGRPPRACREGALRSELALFGVWISALWLVALAVFWLPHRPRMAAAVGGVMLAFGMAVGWMQQLRGAHFLTHTLWSMWIAVFTVDVLYRTLKPAERRAELA